MSGRIVGRVAIILAAAAMLNSPGAAAQQKAYTFNVLNQRSIALTAQYWNPILTHVSKKSGVPLELKLAKTAQEGNAIAEKHGYDFLYTNHFFTAERDRLGYKVIARPAGEGIRSQIVVPEDSAIQNAARPERQGCRLRIAGRVCRLLAADGRAAQGQGQDQRGVYRQPGSLVRAVEGQQGRPPPGVNSSVLARYARRESFNYRALWTSEIYQDLCIMASPKVPADKVAAVRAAFINMIKDPEGRQVLEAGADLLKSTGDLGFVAAENKDYDNYRKFYRTTQVK